MFARPGGLVAVVGNRLFTLPVPKFDPAACPEPIHFAPDVPAGLLGEKGFLRLPALRAAADPVEMTLRQEPPGVTLDAKAGTVGVDPAAIIADLTTAIGTQVGNMRAKPILTGRKPAGVPVWVPLSVLARDKSGQTATVEFGFFVDVPLAAVKARVAAVVAERTGKKPDADPAPLIRPDVADLLREQGRMQQRIETLENKLDELTRKIDMLTKALDGRATDPKK